MRHDVGAFLGSHPHANGLAQRIGVWPQGPRRGGTDDHDLGLGSSFVSLKHAATIDRYLERSRVSGDTCMYDTGTMIRVCGM